MFCQHYDDFLLAAQMGVVVYGYRPKIWFLLNRHDRFDTLLQEIQSTPFDESPGNDIGQFFLFIQLLWQNPFWSYWASSLQLHRVCSCQKVWYLYVSLCRWSDGIYSTVPPDTRGWKKAEGPWCCCHHHWQKVRWQPHTRRQQSQSYRCVICQIIINLVRCDCLYLLDHCNWLQVQWVQYMPSLNALLSLVTPIN